MFHYIHFNYLKTRNLETRLDGIKGIYIHNDEDKDNLAFILLQDEGMHIVGYMKKVPSEGAR